MKEDQIHTRLAHCNGCEKRSGCRETYLVYDSQTACPLGKWGAESVATSVRNFQFGDAVKRIAEPLVQVVDRIAKTNISSCPPCQQRRNSWNLQGVDIPRIP
jgi:hypothetical protein